MFSYGLIPLWIYKSMMKGTRIIISNRSTPMEHSSIIEYITIPCAKNYSKSIFSCYFHKSIPVSCWPVRAQIWIKPESDSSLNHLYKRSGITMTRQSFIFLNGISSHKVTENFSSRFFKIRINVSSIANHWNSFFRFYNLLGMKNQNISWSISFFSI